MGKVWTNSVRVKFRTKIQISANGQWRGHEGWLSGSRGLVVRVARIMRVVRVVSVKYGDLFNTDVTLWFSEVA